jgi:hypothetical protein
MFDEGIGQSAADSSGTGNNGTLGTTGGVDSSDPAWVCVTGGNALAFDGVDDQVLAPDYDVSNTITIATWIKWDVIGASEGIISKRTDTEVAGNWALRGDNATPGYLEWMVWSGLDSSQSLLTSTAISPGVWTHVAVTFNDSTNAADFYINGTLNNSGSISNNLADTPQPIVIGWSGQNVQFFDGSIDDMRIYNRVLTPAEISALAASPPTGCSGTATPTPTATSTPTATATSTATATPTATATAAGISVDTTTSGQTVTTSSMTIAHATSGTNRIMLVGISINNDGLETVTSVTWKGTENLNLVGSATNVDDARVEIWRLVNPSTGSGDVVINFSAVLQRGAVAGVTTFTGVNQSTPLGTFAQATGNNSTPATVNVTSAAGELVFGVVAAEYQTVATGPGQAERWNTTIPTTTGPTTGAGSTEPGAGSVTTSWTIADPSNVHWAVGGVSIKP